jgi:hypothetical protein
MPRPLGPHLPGTPTYDTLRSAAGRLLADVGDAIDRRALDVILDDALAPEVMIGERVDTLMLSSHVFGLDGSRLVIAPTSTGQPGIIAFTERRMIAAHASGIIRLRRSIEAFALDGATRFRAITPMVSGRPVRLFEIANGQGWNRLFLPDPTEVSPAVLAAWDQHIAARLVGALAPKWDDTVLAGWQRGTPTVPTRRPPEAFVADGAAPPASERRGLVDPSGSLPPTGPTSELLWWEK